MDSFLKLFVTIEGWMLILTGVCFLVSWIYVLSGGMMGDSLNRGDPVKICFWTLIPCLLSLVGYIRVGQQHDYGYGLLGLGLSLAILALIDTVKRVHASYSGGG